MPAPAVTAMQRRGVAAAGTRPPDFFLGQWEMGDE